MLVLFPITAVYSAQRTQNVQSHFKYCTSYGAPVKFAHFFQVIVMYLASCLNARLVGKNEELNPCRFRRSVFIWSLRLKNVFHEVYSCRHSQIETLSCLWQWKLCFQRQVFFILSMQYTHPVFKDLHVMLASVVPTASWVIFRLEWFPC